MKLQPATDADLPLVVNLTNLAFRGAGDQASWNSEDGVIAGERITLPALREQVAGTPDGSLLVFRDDPGGPLLASVWIEPAAAGAWYLGMLAVRPDLQARQLGRSVLSAAEAEAKSRGATKIRMTVVNVRDSLIAWYERRGYARTGEIEPFPYDDNRFGTPLRDDLSFEVLEREL